MSYIIYALIDPRNCSTRYVGMTGDMYRRFQEHINGRDSDKNKTKWIEILKSEHIMPIMRTLEVVDTERQAKLREKYWMAHYSAMGETLFNFECNEPSPVKAGQSMKATPNRTYLTATQAAKRLNRTERTVRRWIDQGRLSALRPMKNRLAIPADEVEQLKLELAL